MSNIQPVIEKFVGFYTVLDTAPLDELAMLYHTDAVLLDPFGQHLGLQAIRGYFSHLLGNIQRCRFDIDQPLCGEERFAVSWVMHWSHPRVAGGKALSLPGSSFLQVRDERIIQQRDYYDAGDMIYEHLAVFGWAIRHIKRSVRA